mmetsp:Transcript_29118/g.86216  ORF Transcript_29118/g.86216 Transcript_29118/m.86216 type:complete len:214 (+) Transcript_29118:235-876(+)
MAGKPGYHYMSHMFGTFPEVVHRIWLWGRYAVGLVHDREPCLASEDQAQVAAALLHGCAPLAEQLFRLHVARFQGYQLKKGCLSHHRCRRPPDQQQNRDVPHAGQPGSYGTLSSMVAGHGQRNQVLQQLPAQRATSRPHHRLPPLLPPCDDCWSDVLALSGAAARYPCSCRCGPSKCDESTAGTFRVLAPEGVCFGCLVAHCVGSSNRGLDWG